MKSAIFNFQEEEINHLSYGILCWGNSEPIDPPTGITIENNVIEFVLGSAISLGSNTESVLIQGNSFDEIIQVEYQGSMLAIGIQAELSNNLEISNNSFSNLLQSNSLIECTNTSITGEFLSEFIPHVMEYLPS